MDLHQECYLYLKSQIDNFDDLPQVVQEYSIVFFACSVAFKVCDSLGVYLNERKTNERES